MNKLFSGAFIASALAITQPVLAAPPQSTWNLTRTPEQPLRYIEAAPVLRLAPQIANAETYAPESLLRRLYPSITPPSARRPLEEANNAPSIASKNRGFVQNGPRGNLSPSYVQEFAYIDTYSNIRKYEQYFSFPSIRMSLAMPRFGNGSGGGYQPLQFGFGPAAFRFW